MTQNFASTAAERLSAGISPLLAWYGTHARTLPWRSEPTPYRVWISEVMLQQTRVAAVLEYFPRFLAELPDVRTLAACPEERLLKLWQGLGYYSRARNLQRAAQMICTDFGGRFPDSYELLLTLPGVGEYTAGAIASIAFGQPVPAIDGNVLRILTRFLADDRDIARSGTKRDLRALTAAVMPADKPGVFNQALMELGALVCVPNGAPQCGVCPWAALCLANAEDLTKDLPVKSGKKPRRIENRTVFLIFRHDRIALRRRAEKGLLAGMWELPNEPGPSLPPEARCIHPESVEDGGTGTHIFTHIEWHMTGVVIRAADDVLPDGWIWADRRALRERYPVPNAFAPFRDRIEREMLQAGAK